MRPVDILEQLVRDAHGDISSRQQEFVAFFEKYGHTQACAMCLAIICANFGTDNPEKGTSHAPFTEVVVSYLLTKTWG